MDVEGKTQNVRVESSEPPGVFDKAAMSAVRRWRYEPASIDGVPTEVPAAYDDPLHAAEVTTFRRESRMKPMSAERRSRILTASVGALLMVVMGGVLTAGFRLATQMKEGFAALQVASALQWQPPLIAQQLTSLRDRLESRAYAGQTLADLKERDRDLRPRSRRDWRAQSGGSAQVDGAQLLWRQHQPVLDPVKDFSGQPYVDSDESGSSLSRAGRRTVRRREARPAVRAREHAATCSRCSPASARSCRSAPRRRPAA